jgi:hypothetical protein
MNRHNLQDITLAATIAITIAVLAAFYLTTTNNLMRMEEDAVYKGYGTFDSKGNFKWMP